MTRRRPLILLMCLAIAGLVLLLDAAWPSMRFLELRSLDWRFDARGPRPAGAGVAIVAIDEKSLAEPDLNQWPWPRSVYAEVVERLHGQGAAVIVFDIGFTEPQSADEDKAFATAMQRAGNVVLGAGYAGPGAMGHGSSEAQEAVEITDDRLAASALMSRRAPPAPPIAPAWLRPSTRALFWTLPIPRLLKSASAAGAVLLAPDADAIYRRFTPAWRVDTGRIYPSLGVLAAARKLGVAPGEIRVGPSGELRLGTRRVLPAPRDGGLLIDFAGASVLDVGSHSYPCYSFTEVRGRMRSDRERARELVAGQIAKDAFKDRIVFVGATASGIPDPRPTPYSTRTVGVEIHATIADAILENRFFHEPGDWVTVLLVLGAGLASSGVLALSSLLRATFITMVAGILYAVLCLWSFAGPRVVLPLTAPLITLGACWVWVVAYRSQVEYRDRLRHRAYLDMYVTPQVAERILSDPNAATLSAQRAEVSALFADIRGFTPLTEALPPETMLGLLNEYFDRMVAVIMAQEGTLVHYAGDAIMAAWGAPVPQPDHARRSVLAGLEMLAALRDLHTGWRERGLPTFEIGIGINSGEALAGNVGGAKRAQYAIIGDSVNTAARLETLNKEMETHMIIGEATYQSVTDLVQVRPLGPVTVKGKTEILTVYEVLGLREGGGQKAESRKQKAEGGRQKVEDGADQSASGPATASRMGMSSVDGDAPCE